MSTTTSTTTKKKWPKREDMKQKQLLNWFSPTTSTQGSAYLGTEKEDDNDAIKNK